MSVADVVLASRAFLDASEAAQRAEQRWPPGQPDPKPSVYP